MNSLALLADYAQPISASEIAFYATAATVIPVLYLALAVQGTAYEALLKAASFARPGPAERPAGSPVRRIPGLASAIVIASMGLAVLILAFSVLGEITAIVALATGGIGDSNRVYVEAAVIFLTLAVAAGPAWKAVSAIAGEFRPEPGTRSTTTDQPASRPEPDTSATTADVHSAPGQALAPPDIDPREAGRG